ncbi:hypothetical protein T08_2847 [Trichinella sp. T8]|nr:hypothetical protein T08_2847 [Trichinella sp. T8]
MDRLKGPKKKATQQPMTMRLFLNSLSIPPGTREKLARKTMCRSAEPATSQKMVEDNMRVTSASMLGINCITYSDLAYSD